MTLLNFPCLRASKRARACHLSVASVLHVGGPCIAQESIRENTFRIVGVGVPHIGSVGAIEIVRFAPGARVKARRIRVTERPMPNVNHNRATASRTAIGVRSTINLKDTRRMSHMPRIGCVIGGKGRQRRNDHARCEYCKAEKRSRHDLIPPIADDLRPSNPDEQLSPYPKNATDRHARTEMDSLPIRMAASVMASCLLNDLFRANSAPWI